MGDRSVSARRLGAERRLDPAAHLAERLAPQDHLVAVLEERAGGAVGQLDRLLAVPAQLDQAAALLGARGPRSCRWRAGRPCAGSRRSPSGERAAGRSTSTGAGCWSAPRPSRSARPRAGCRTPRAPRAGTGAARAPGAPEPHAAGELVERDDPGGHRGGERLPEKRPERLVFPGLDVARRPVVHEHHPEHVVECALHGTGSPIGSESRPRTPPRARCRGACSGRTRAPAAAPAGAARACRSARPSRRARGSPPAGAASSAEAAPHRAGTSARGSSRGGARSRSPRSRPPRTACASSASPSSRPSSTRERAPGARTRDQPP